MWTEVGLTPDRWSVIVVALVFVVFTCGFLVVKR